MTIPYCTAQDVIDCCAWPAFGQIPATAQTRLIATASSKIDKAARRTFRDASGNLAGGFAAQSVTEALDGRNLPTVWLTLRPVISVSAITINGDALDNTYGTAWTFDPGTGKLCRGSGQDATRFQPWFPAGIRNVVVSYWGGYQTLPDQVVMATAWYIRYCYDQGKVSGLYSSESIGDWSGTLNASLLAGTVPAHVLAMLSDYVQDDAF